MNTLPTEWSIMPLGSACELISGQHINTKDYNVEGKGIGYLTGPADFGRLHPTVTKWTENPKRTAVSGDILLTVKGSGVGKINFMPDEELAISRQLMAIRSSRIDMGYLYSFLQLQYSYFQSLSNGAAIPGISRSDVLSLQIPAPPLPEQQRIVSILDEVFEGVGKVIANVERNLKNSRELFESYLNGVFARKGEGWKETNIENCFKVKSGDFLPKKKMNLSGNFGVYGGNGPTGKHDQLNLSGENIVIGRVGAKCGNVRLVSSDIWLTDNAFYISEYKKNFDKGFLTLALRKAQLGQTANQAAQPVISYKTIKPVTLSFPLDIEKQRDITKASEKLKSKTENLEVIYNKKLTALEELKQSILQKAFTGELTAKTVDKIMEPV